MSTEKGFQKVSELKSLIDSYFDWVVNKEGYGMIALFTDQIVCSLIVGASES